MLSTHFNHCTVNCIEVADHIVWLHIELNIYGGNKPYWLASQWAQYLLGDLNHLSPHALIFFFFLQKLILSIYQCVEMDRWLLLHLKMCNLEMLASSKRPHMKRSSRSFNIEGLMVNERWCLIGMLDARMGVNDNINQNWANVICKWSVSIPPVHFHTLGNQKNWSI